MSFKDFKTVCPSICSRWIATISIRLALFSMVAVPALAIVCAITFRTNKFAPVILTLGAIYAPVCKQLFLPKLLAWSMDLIAKGKMAMDMNLAKEVHNEMVAGTPKQEIAEALIEGGMTEDYAEYIIKLASSPKLFWTPPEKKQ